MRLLSIFSLLLLGIQHVHSQPNEPGLYARSEALNRTLQATPPATTKAIALQRDSFTRALDELLHFAAQKPSDKYMGLLFDNVLLFRNASMDRDVLLRQKLRYTDERTRALFAQRDSLLRLIGRQYEQPLAQRRPVQAWEQQANVLEDQVLTRFKKSKAHFNALSLVLADALYQKYPTAGHLLCSKKIKNDGGSTELADQIYKYAQKQDVRVWDYKDIGRSLEREEALVEFVTYRTPETPDARAATRYGALVLRRSFPAPRWVELCTQRQLDDLLANSSAEAFYLQYLYAPPAEGTDQATLHQLLWQRLEPLLQGIERIYYAPAGDIHRINLGALAPNDRSPTLQRNRTFVCINSARSLVNPGDQSVRGNTFSFPCLGSPTLRADEVDDILGNTAYNYYGDIVTREAVLWGNVYYDMDSAAIRRGLLLNATDGRDSLHPEFKKKRALPYPNNEAWELLFGTRPEIESVGRFLTNSEYIVSYKQGYSASEEAFKMMGNQAVSPRIIHIATHGYFLADDTVATNDHPLNHCGLILAGANHAWKKGVPLPNMEDGILTAFEIGSLRLENTELVVLSACETGLGFIENNEGVWGLQRAFKRAGVRNVLVSLWSVPDTATKELMEEFYRNCLVRNLPLRDALRAAQETLRTKPGYENPFYWAGFLLLE
jgi:hypothetical protein